MSPFAVIGSFLEFKRAPKGAPGEDLRAHSILGICNSLDLLIQWFRHSERSLGRQVHEEMGARNEKKPEQSRQESV